MRGYFLYGLEKVDFSGIESREINFFKKVGSQLFFVQINSEREFFGKTPPQNPVFVHIGEGINFLKKALTFCSFRGY